MSFRNPRHRRVGASRLPDFRRFAPQSGLQRSDQRERLGGVASYVFPQSTPPPCRGVPPAGFSSLCSSVRPTAKRPTGASRRCDVLCLSAIHATAVSGRPDCRIFVALLLSPAYSEATSGSVSAVWRPMSFRNPRHRRVGASRLPDFRRFAPQSGLQRSDQRERPGGVASYVFPQPTPPPCRGVPT